MRRFGGIVRGGWRGSVAILFLCGLIAGPAPAAGEGPFRVIDVKPGELSSQPFSLVKMGERLFFTARAPGNDTAVWTSDGTAAGTRLVAEVCSGDCFGVYPWRLAVAGDLLFFDAGTEGDEHRGLWRSDGTAAGTFQVGFCENPDAMTAVGDALFFTCVDAMGRELWTSDGTLAGTFRVKDIELGPDSSQRECYDDFADCMVGMGGTLFFGADTSKFGRELWRSDGTEAGTRMVADLEPGEDGGSVGWPTVFEDALFFSRGPTCYAGDLWRSDGTAAGTEVIAAAPHEPEERIFCPLSWGPDFLTAVAGDLYFVTGDVQDGDVLWKTDGTAEGTRPVRWGFDYLHPLGGSPSLLFFWHYVDNDMELWATEGNRAWKLRRFAEHASLPEAAFLGETIFFPAREQRPGGLDVWSSDGSTAGTSLVEELVDPRHLTGGRGPFFLRASHPDLGSELFVLDSWPEPFEVTVASTGSGSGTLTSRPLGIDCGGDCQEIWPYGSRVRLTATPAYGSQFEGWTGHEDCADGRLKVFDDRACTAMFGPCSLSEVLDLSGVTLDDTRELTACNEIRAGPALTLTPSADVMMRAGNQVVFDAFSMAPGAQLAVAIEPPD